MSLSALGTGARLQVLGQLQFKCKPRLHGASTSLVLPVGDMAQAVLVSLWLQVTPDDEFTLSCEKYAKLGYGREVIMMALAACGTQPEDKQKVGTMLELGVMQEVGCAWCMPFHAPC